VSLLGWLAVGCAAQAPTLPKPTEAVSHIYPLPLDNVLGQATTLMQKHGWVVKRAGDGLLTNWQGTATGTLISYRVFGRRIDSGLSAIRVERMVATTSTSFGTDHPVTPSGFNGALPFTLNPEFASDPLNESAAGTAPPPGVSSGTDLSRPSPWVVSHHERDGKLELELQDEIDPTPSVTAESVMPSVSATSAVDAGSQLTELAGIWDGTFTFKGTVVGTFTGEVTVAVDGRSIEVDDFCPEQGGTLSATGANRSAAWEGSLACSAIAVKGCPAAALKYNFAHATLDGNTLTVVAAGTVETPPDCLYAGGALSATFVAQRADYVHIVVTRVSRMTACTWPSDWEDFNSSGSMAMPDVPNEGTGYLGIIRAKGSRLPEIQALLRQCHQVVLLHGQPVSMRLAVSRPRHD
jgi:hypothetical protein